MFDEHRFCRIVLAVQHLSRRGNQNAAVDVRCDLRDHPRVEEWGCVRQVLRRDRGQQTGGPVHMVQADRAGRRTCARRINTSDMSSLSQHYFSDRHPKQKSANVFCGYGAKELIPA